MELVPESVVALIVELVVDLAPELAVELDPELVTELAVEFCKPASCHFAPRWLVVRVKKKRDRDPLGPVPLNCQGVKTRLRRLTLGFRGDSWPNWSISQNRAPLLPLSQAAERVLDQRHLFNQVDALRRRLPQQSGQRMLVG